MTAFWPCSLPALPEDPPSESGRAAPVELRPGRALLAIAVWALLQTPSFAAPAAQPGEADDLAAFFPLRVGDLWTYETSASSSWARTVTSREPTSDGVEALRIDESSQDFRIQRWQNDGLMLFSLHFADGTELEFEQPLLLVPSTLAVGTTHEVEGTYTFFEWGADSHKGTQSFVVERLPDRSVETPAGVFEKCLILRVRSRRQADTGAVAESEQRETRAAGIGLIAVERTEAGPRGEGSWEARLTGASIGGRLLPP